MSGFAEWPPGKRNLPGDIDSGPVHKGIGSTATALGLAVTNVMGDDQRRDLIASQLIAIKPTLKLMILLDSDNEKYYTLNGMIDLSSRYVSGFLFGDACLFYASTAVDFNDFLPRRKSLQ